MRMGRYVDRFWAGIMLTVTVFVIILGSGFIFEYFGMEPFFSIMFNFEAMTIYSWLQIAAVALLLGVSAAWLRRNSKAMRRM